MGIGVELQMVGQSSSFCAAIIRKRLLTFKTVSRIVQEGRTEYETMECGCGWQTV